MDTTEAFVSRCSCLYCSLTSAMLLRQCIDALAGAINKFSGGVVLATKQKYCVKTCTHWHSFPNCFLASNADIFYLLTFIWSHIFYIYWCDGVGMKRCRLQSLSGFVEWRWATTSGWLAKLQRRFGFATDAQSQTTWQPRGQRDNLKLRTKRLWANGRGISNPTRSTWRKRHSECSMADRAGDSEGL